MFRKIIVGLDGSEKAKTALRIGCDLARIYSGTVTMVHVLKPDMDDLGADEDADGESSPTFEDIEDAGRRVLKAGLAIADELDFTSVKTHMPYGDAATEILAHAQAIDADLIITGRRGLGSLSSLVLGSTTQQINHEAKCACLSVPHQSASVK